MRIIGMMIIILLAAPEITWANKEAKKLELVMKKREKLLTILDRELKVIQTHLNSNRYENSQLMYRMVELYTEKMKLVKENENEKFLNEATKGVKVNKADYFRQSLALYEEALKLGKAIIKRFPKFRNIGQLYHTLALNNRDYADGKLIESYLKKAIAFARRGSLLEHRSRADLADYYYNTKRYSEAVKNYLIVLRNKKENWRPKYAYNMAWCLLKLKKHQQSIDVLTKALYMGRDEKYVDISDQILRSAGLFFTDADQVENGVAFFLKEAKEPRPYMIGMGKLLREKGHFRKAEWTLNETYKISHTSAQKAEVQLELLTVYKQFSDFTGHFQTAVKVFEAQKSDPLDENNKLIFIEKMNEVAGILQTKVAEKIYADIPEKHNQFLHMAVEYLEMLAQVDLKEAPKYKFLIGETYFSVEDFKKAIDTYFISYNLAQEKHADIALKRQILDSTLATLSRLKLPALELRAYTIKTYENYLVVFPATEKAPEIYQRLFATYLQAKDELNAERTLLAYDKNCPKDKESQRTMATALMDVYIEKKDADNLARWVKLIVNGFMGFEKAFIDKSEIVLGTILFNKYETLTKKGDLVQATEGYMALYDNEKYTANIKGKSAYNASLIYLEQGQVENSLNWLQKGLELMPLEEILKLKSDLLALSVQYFLLQDLLSSAELSRTMVKKLCKSPSKELDEFYRNAVIYSFTERRPRQAMKDFNLHEKCSISDKKEVSVAEELLALATRPGYEEVLLSQFEELEKLKEVKEKLYNFTFKTYLLAKKNGDSSLARKTRKELGSILKRPTDPTDQFKVFNADFVKAYFSLEEFEREARAFSRVELEVEEEFDENKFNSQLEKAVTQMQDLTTKGLQLSKAGHALVNLEIYGHLYRAYRGLARKFDGLHMKTGPKEMKEAFRANMSQLAQGLRSGSSKFKKLAQKNWQVSLAGASRQGPFWVFSHGAIPDVPLYWDGHLEGVFMKNQGGI